MSDRLQELAVFIRAAESGSFSRAARELGLSQPSVSRIVGELEARLGVTLLLRTTRRITLTHAGELFLDRAREILAGLEEAEDAARGLDSLRGLIRLALPVIYGTREVIPRLAEFLAMHPQLRVEMTVSDERQDLVAEGADVAIRLGDARGFGVRRPQAGNARTPGGCLARLPAGPRQAEDACRSHVARLHHRSARIQPRQLDVSEGRHRHFGGCPRPHSHQFRPRPFSPA